jgi:hypothetical protein
MTRRPRLDKADAWAIRGAEQGLRNIHPFRRCSTQMIGRRRIVSTYNIVNMASGEELGRYFARTVSDALNAMARMSGFENYEQACGALPAIRDQLFVTEL